MILFLKDVGSFTVCKSVEQVSFLREFRNQINVCRILAEFSTLAALYKYPCMCY